MMARVSSSIASNNINVERHAYCLCLHVRPATIFVAVINLAGSLICALLTFFFMVSNDHHSYFAARFVRDETSRINLISVLMYLLLAWVSAMLLYGVIKSKPRYILPFFGIQFIDYLFTLPQFFALFTNPYHYYATSAKTTKNMMEIHGVNSVPDSKLGTSDFDDLANTTVWASSYQRNFQVYTTTLLVMTFFMIFKTYFLCVVWKCYRYLHMKEFILPITLHNAATASGLTAGIGAGGQFDHDLPPLIITGRAANIPPPDYDEATKLPDYKPPEYTQVIDGQNPDQFRTISLDSPPSSQLRVPLVQQQQQQQASNQQESTILKNNIDNV